jgi:hypothetical protein
VTIAAGKTAAASRAGTGWTATLTLDADGLRQVATATDAV